METRSVISFLDNYWVNYNNVRKNIALYNTPDLYTLDYLTVLFTF